MNAAEVDTRVYRRLDPWIAGAIAQQDDQATRDLITTAHALGEIGTDFFVHLDDDLKPEILLAAFVTDAKGNAIPFLSCHGHHVGLITTGRPPSITAAYLPHPDHDPDLPPDPIPLTVEIGPDGETTT